MEKLRANAAGIDIGAKKIFVSVEGDQVQSFDTFTEDFYLAGDYLLSKGITTVAMEATGIYWIILTWLQLYAETGNDLEKWCTENISLHGWAWPPDNIHLEK